MVVMEQMDDNIYDFKLTDKKRNRTRHVTAQALVIFYFLILFLNSLDYRATSSCKLTTKTTSGSYSKNGRAWGSLGTPVREKAPVFKFFREFE